MVVADGRPARIAHAVTTVTDPADLRLFDGQGLTGSGSGRLRMPGIGDDAAGHASNVGTRRGSGIECESVSALRTATIAAMFTRRHRIGRHLYIEALESYREPDTGRPRHRCLARWRAERSFAEELGQTRFGIEHAASNITYWQGIIDGTVRPRVPIHRKRAVESVRGWQRRLDDATAHLSALTAARDAGLPAHDAGIEQAQQAEAARWAGIGASIRAMFQPQPPPDLTGLAERVRRLTTQNNP